MNAPICERAAQRIEAMPPSSATGRSEGGDGPFLSVEVEEDVELGAGRDVAAHVFTREEDVVRAVGEEEADGGGAGHGEGLASTDLHGSIVADCPFRRTGARPPRVPKAMRAVLLVLSRLAGPRRRPELRRGPGDPHRGAARGPVRDQGDDVRDARSCRRRSPRCSCGWECRARRGRPPPHRTF